MNWRGRCANRKFVRSTKAIKVKGEYKKDEKGFRVRKKGASRGKEENRKKATREERPGQVQYKTCELELLHVLQLKALTFNVNDEVVLLLLLS